MNTDGQGMELPEAKERLVEDLRGFIGDAEQLLQAMANRSGESLAGVRAEFEKKLMRAKDMVSEMESVAAERYEEAASTAEHFVRENPWRAIGIGVAVGVVIGFLMHRR